MIRTEHMHADAAYRERLRACELDSVPRVLERVDGRIAAWSRTTDSLYVAGAGDMPGFYIKRHLFPDWNRRLRGTFRGTFFGLDRGQAEYRALNALRAVGVPTVRPVAYGGRRVGHFLTACFLITEEVPGAVNLTTYAQEVIASRRPMTWALRRALAETLAEQVLNMHRNGVWHGNLFWRNLLVRDGPDGRPEFFFLDPQAPRPWERLGPTGRGAVRELAQMLVSALPFTSRTDGLRFLRKYNGQRLNDESKEHVRQMNRMAKDWQRHELRRVHMNALFARWNQRLAAERADGEPGGVHEPAGSAP